MRVHSPKHEASGIPWILRAHLSENHFAFRISNSLPAQCRGSPRGVPACFSCFPLIFLRHSLWYSAVILFRPRVGAEGAFSSSQSKASSNDHQILILIPLSAYTAEGRCWRTDSLKWSSKFRWSPQEMRCLCMYREPLSQTNALPLTCNDPPFLLASSLLRGWVLTIARETRSCFPQHTNYFPVLARTIKNFWPPTTVPPSAWLHNRSWLR